MLLCSFFGSSEAGGSFESAEIKNFQLGRTCLSFTDAWLETEIEVTTSSVSQEEEGGKKGQVC